MAGYVFKEIGLFILNLLIEVWHFIAIPIKNILKSVIVCIIVAILLVRPIYKQYNDFAEQSVSNSTLAQLKKAESSNIWSLDSLNEHGSDEDYVTIADVPVIMRETIIYMTDTTFADNTGVDNQRIKDAIDSLIKSQGNKIEDTDTITQRVAEIAFLKDKAGFDKYCEKYLTALKLNKKYSKTEIMEIYCNIVDCANGITGLQSAAHTYFKEDLWNLSLKKQIYLCVVAYNSREYNPLLYNKTTMEKTNEILVYLQKQGKITEEEYEKASKEAVIIQK